jgi:hypothetical protein
MWRTSGLALLAATAILPSVYADSVLKTDGFNDCGGDGSIKVNKVDISFDKGSNKVNFDLQGDSEKEQEVTATLVVEAYGVKVFEQEFDPCDDANKVEQLCPRKRPYNQPCDHANKCTSPFRLLWCSRLARSSL